MRSCAAVWYNWRPERGGDNELGKEPSTTGPVHLLLPRFAAVYKRTSQSIFSPGGSMQATIAQRLTSFAALIGETVLAPPTREVEEVDEAVDDDIRHEPLYQVLIHNDDVTPYDYVVRILQRIFLLSEEMADHVAWTAHNEEVAVVVIRTRAEAEKLIMAARGHARMDGYPLTFSMEPVD
jgi:ATP-dependent Clp protease adaptor protein ClpS